MVRLPDRVPPAAGRAPRLVRAAAAEVAPVPPLARATVPVTLAAVPETFPVTLPVRLPVTGPLNWVAVRGPVSVPPESGTAPRLARAAAAEVAPVPPLARVTVPVTLAAVPETLPVTLPVRLPVTGPVNWVAVRGPVRVPPESGRAPRLTRAAAAVAAPVP